MHVWKTTKYVEHQVVHGEFESSLLSQIQLLQLRTMSDYKAMHDLNLSQVP